MLPRALWRPAIVFFAIAQVVLAFAPLMEGRFGPDARAHVEQAGTNVHHAHNDADCAACTARDLMAAAEPGSQTVAIDAAATFNHSTSPLFRTWHLASRATQPRAPPAANA